LGSTIRKVKKERMEKLGKKITQGKAIDVKITDEHPLIYSV